MHPFNAAANLRPSYSSGASAIERFELDVANEAEGEPVGSLAITTEISFGSFRLLPAQRLLLDEDKPVQLGSRALDVLIALVERPSELVSKEELMTRVWPKTFVHPANLAVYRSGLRRALHDGPGRNRFFINVHGRGYVFVAPIEIHGSVRPAYPASPNKPLHNGVDRLITEEPIAAPRVSRNRLVTVVGPDRRQQRQSDRRRRPLRAGLVNRPTTNAIKHSLVTTSQ